MPGMVWQGLGTQNRGMARWRQGELRYGDRGAVRSGVAGLGKDIWAGCFRRGWAR